MKIAKLHLCQFLSSPNITEPLGFGVIGEIYMFGVQAILACCSHITVVIDCTGQVANNWQGVKHFNNCELEMFDNEESKVYHLELM